MSSTWETMYFWRVRRTRRRWGKVECFQEAWATLAREARLFTCWVERLGTVPRVDSVEGEKQWRSVGFLGSNSGGGLVADDFDVSILGSSTSFSMEGTLSNSPSRVNLMSLHTCHSLFTK